MSASTRPATRFDAAVAARLDKLYASPQMFAQRTAFRRALAARPGEQGLDIGAGLGHLSCELAAEVAADGRIVAVDSSPDMIAATRRRVDSLGLSSLVETRPSDAVALDLADESFDFAVAVQVYSYVEDVALAVREAARVLRRGGRLAVLETDWDLCTYESSDREVTRRMLDGSSRFAHPHLPTRLHRLFRHAGLALERCEAFPVVETRYDPDSFGAGLVDITRDAAVRRGVPTAEADAWAADIRARSSDGEYFFCANRFIFVGTK
jgi:ubiquinone/menaquinone biosynthesis C-methylase UbiE